MAFLITGPRQGQSIYEFHVYLDGEMTPELQGYVRHDPASGRWQVIRPEPLGYDTADEARAALYHDMGAFEGWGDGVPPAGYSSRPRFVTLCGSTRFCDDAYKGPDGLTPWERANLEETRALRIVLGIGVNTKSDAGLTIDEAEKARLDELHLRKIDLADEVLILNVGGYVGASTRREIEYAIAHGKHIRWLEPEHAIEV